MNHWLDDTPLGKIIDRAVDNWAKILGFTDERARNEDGTYRGDDPSTPDVNEAWKSGKTKKKATRKKRKKVSK
tara:strand:- start:361 stop:579 length:219 start_codon:yes stop_codon:yes gene_type:complete